jgi:hypothetical protein
VLVLGFPSGRISARVDKLIIAGFVIGTGLVQVIWLLVRPVPDTALLISADAGLADAIDRYQTGFNATMGLRDPGQNFKRRRPRAPSVRSARLRAGHGGVQLAAARRPSRAVERAQANRGAGDQPPSGARGKRVRSGLLIASGSAAAAGTTPHLRNACPSLVAYRGPGG